MVLFTIGYEGVSTSLFWETLKENGVELLMDVRATPLSRKPGFSKGALCEAAKTNGLNYENWITMGCPRDILTKYRADRNWEEYTKSFWRYLRTREDDIRALTQVTQVYRCALMCFEADPNFCHRSYVAQYAQEWQPSLKVVHLLPASKVAIKQNSLFD